MYSYFSKSLNIKIFKSFSFENLLFEKYSHSREKEVNEFRLLNIGNVFSVLEL